MSKVLIVEDDKSLIDVYREEFELEGFTVETAGDGQEGIEKMASFLPEIVILDLVMPKMSGFDFLKSVKDNPAFKNIPIIVFSNLYADATDLLKNWGATDFILKVNYTPGQIVTKAKEILNHGKIG